MNLRLALVSLWGNGTRLRDYAWKEWSGLLSGYYARRWEIFFRHEIVRASP